MTVIVLAMVVGTYVGVTVFKGDMTPIDDLIIPQPSSASNVPSFANLGPAGIYIGFTVAGAVGGFLIGYIMPSVFNQENAQIKREEHV